MRMRKQGFINKNRQKIYKIINYMLLDIKLMVAKKYCIYKMYLKDWSTMN